MIIFVCLYTHLKKGCSGAFGLTPYCARVRGKQEKALLTACNLALSVLKSAEYGEWEMCNLLIANYLRNPLNISQL